jgi:hypothetical protein
LVVCLVCFVHLVGFVQPNKRDKPEQLAASDKGSVEAILDRSSVTEQLAIGIILKTFP